VYASVDDFESALNCLLALETALEAEEREADALEYAASDNEEADAKLTTAFEALTKLAEAVFIALDDDTIDVDNFEA
jgi:hypothetical protein